MVRSKKNKDFGQRCLACGGRLTQEMLIGTSPYNKKENLAQCSRCGVVNTVSDISNLEVESDRV